MIEEFNIIYWIIAYYVVCSTRVIGSNSWSSCSKSCDIGTRTRTSEDGVSITEYCNLHNCPQQCVNWYDCSSSAKCRNNTCVCEKGQDFDPVTCSPSVGNCVLREDPTSAIGFRDPLVKYQSSYYKLKSCTTNDNTKYEVHVIEIYGEQRSDYEVSVVPRGIVNKPIIVVLSSYSTTYWKINTDIGLNKVFYGGYAKDSSVERLSSSRCEVPVFVSPYEYDTGALLRGVSSDYGPITSYTYYYKLNSNTRRIILQVGGSPLQVLDQSYRFNKSQSCSRGNVNCPEYYNQGNDFTKQLEWTPWSACSKDCNIGTKGRCRYRQGKDIVDYEELFCNTHFCPVKTKCDYSWACPSRKCVDGECDCSGIEGGYNEYTCKIEFNNCTLRENSVMAIGYKDLTKAESYSSYKLTSCTADENPNYEVHVIGLYGQKNKPYTVNVVPRGPVNKPIIIVLTSYNPIQWNISSTVDLENILYRGAGSTVDVRCDLCDYNITYRPTLSYAYGADDKDVIVLLKSIEKYYGPVTSFTGYYEISSDDPTIILNVGGNPLQVLPRNYKYNWNMTKNDANLINEHSSTVRAKLVVYQTTVKEAAGGLEHATGISYIR